MHRTGLGFTALALVLMCTGVAQSSGKTEATQIQQITPPEPQRTTMTQLPVAPHSESQVETVHGADRCDPATGSPAARADCERILRDEASTAAGASSSTAVVDTTRGASTLVNGILNSGTGTVATLPPAK